MLICKPVNWACCVYVNDENDDKRSGVIREAYKKGMRLRLDSTGKQLAVEHRIVPIACLAIATDERRQEWL